MAFATILTGLSAAMSVGSGLIGLQQGIAGGKAAEQAGIYQSGILKNQATLGEYNAQAADRDAATALENAKRAGFAGQQRAMDQDLEARSQIDDVISASASTGLTGRTPLAVVASLHRLADRDRMRIAEAGQIDAGNFRTQAQGFKEEAADLRSGAQLARTDATMARANAASAASASRLSGYSSLLSGIAGGGNAILDGSRSQAVRHDLSNLGGWFKRKYGALRG